MSVGAVEHYRDGVQDTAFRYAVWVEYQIRCLRSPMNSIRGCDRVRKHQTDENEERRSRRRPCLAHQPRLLTEPLRILEVARASRMMFQFSPGNFVYFCCSFREPQSTVGTRRNALRCAVWTRKRKFRDLPTWVYSPQCSLSCHEPHRVIRPQSYSIRWAVAWDSVMRYRSIGADTAN